MEIENSSKMTVLLSLKKPCPSLKTYERVLKSRIQFQPYRVLNKRLKASTSRDLALNEESIKSGQILKNVQRI